jgi:hypothetical protein
VPASATRDTGCMEGGRTPIDRGGPARAQGTGARGDVRAWRRRWPASASPLISMRVTVSALSCPILCDRPMACRSNDGFRVGSHRLVAERGWGCGWVWGASQRSAASRGEQQQDTATSAACPGKHVRATHCPNTLRQAPASHDVCTRGERDASAPRPVRQQEDLGGGVGLELTDRLAASGCRVGVGGGAAQEAPTALLPVHTGRRQSACLAAAGACRARSDRAPLRRRRLRVGTRSPAPTRAAGPDEVPRLQADGGQAVLDGTQRVGELAENQDLHAG